MLESTTEKSSPTGASLRNSRPQRVGVLLAWVVILAVVSSWLCQRDDDPGVGHTAVNASIILSVLGFAVWTVGWSGWRFGTRFVAVLGPLGLLWAFYSQLLPVEVILDGDVGFVGVRWRANQPDRLLTVPESYSELPLDWQTTAQDYPRFLGTGYWANVSGVTLDVDWQTNPPRELWREVIGAGWSAFSIAGNFAVTQEQRREQELVTCYKVLTGEIVWTHADPVRWEPRGSASLGYVGPRATPTIHEGRVFTLGATGILNCIDAPSGKRNWSHDTLEKHRAENVMWGKACSPLIVGDTVVVSVGGTDEQSLVAYNIESGNVIWNAGSYRSSYASPVLAEFAGKPQVVSVNEDVVTAHDAADGKLLWKYKWPSKSDANAATSQPVPLEGDRLLLSKGYGLGAALVQVTRTEEGGWETTPVWKGGEYGQLPVMKTKMGNVLVHDGYVYGLDNVNLECIELETGKRQWKKRRSPTFGHGQIMLVGDIILVLTESGELVLVETSPYEYRELAAMRVFSDHQITWNNPAFAPPYLLLRNAEEAVCYELSLKELVAAGRAGPHF